MFKRSFVVFATASMLSVSLALVVSVAGCDGPTEGPPSESAQKTEEQAKNSMMEYMQTKGAQKGKNSGKK